MKKTSFNSWEELRTEIKNLFDNEDDGRYRMMIVPGQYKEIIEVVDEVQNNAEKYLKDPESFHLFACGAKKEKLYVWMPYLSGDMAALLEMKFQNESGEYLDIDSVGEAYRNKIGLDKIFARFNVNTDTLKKYQDTQ